MTLQVSGFDWDDGNRAKCQKHGVSIAEIEALFACGHSHCARSETLGGRGPFNCSRENKHRKAAIRGIHDAHDKWPPSDPPSDGSIYACQGDRSL
jgi:hypothetical protein